MWLPQPSISCANSTGPTYQFKATGNGQNLPRLAGDPGISSCWKTRVAVTSNSHKAIGNLMVAVAARAREQQVTLQAIQKLSNGELPPDPAVEVRRDNDDPRLTTYPLVAGTACSKAPTLANPALRVSATSSMASQQCRGNVAFFFQCRADCIPHLRVCVRRRL
jgi:hypothetical protein